MRHLAGTFFCSLFLLLVLFSLPKETYADAGHPRSCLTLAYSPSLQYASPNTLVTFTAKLTNNCVDIIDVFVWANTSEFGDIQEAGFANLDADGWVYAGTPNLQPGEFGEWSWSGRPNGKCPLGNNELFSQIQVYERDSFNFLHQQIDTVSSPKVTLYAGVSVKITNNSSAPHTFRVAVKSKAGAITGPYSLDVGAFSDKAFPFTIDVDCSGRPFTIQWDVDGSGNWRFDTVPPGSFYPVNGCLEFVDIVYNPGPGPLPPPPPPPPPAPLPPPPPPDVCPNIAGDQASVPPGMFIDGSGNCVAPTCPNNIIEPGEQCDPPNGTTCDAFCQTITVCNVFSCSPWTPGACGGGGFSIQCTAGQRFQSRTCTDSNCTIPNKERCVTDPTCVAPPPPPPPVPGPPPPVPGPLPPPPSPGCDPNSCTGWLPGPCGGRGISLNCASYQHIETRTCSGGGCAISDTEKCENDSSCGAVPPPPGPPPPPPPPSICTTAGCINDNIQYFLFAGPPWVIYSYCSPGDKCEVRPGVCNVGCTDQGPTFISGTVFYDLNENGIKEAGEKEYKGPWTVNSSYQDGPYRPLSCREYFWEDNAYLWWDYATCARVVGSANCGGRICNAADIEAYCGQCRLPLPPPPALYCYPFGNIGLDSYPGYDYGY